jgi:hypothetical protein
VLPPDDLTQPVGGPMPPIVHAILSAARHAQEGWSMAGLLLRVDGHVRGKLMIESILSIPPTAALGQHWMQKKKSAAAEKQPAVALCGAIPENQIS